MLDKLAQIGKPAIIPPIHRSFAPASIITREFLKLVDEAVAERNSHLGKVETIKQYKILGTEFSKDTGELTNTLKVKRKAVLDKYKGLIDQMYPD